MLLERELNTVQICNKQVVADCDGCSLEARSRRARGSWSCSSAPSPRCHSAICCLAVAAFRCSPCGARSGLLNSRVIDSVRKLSASHLIPSPSLSLSRSLSRSVSFCLVLSRSLPRKTKEYVQLNRKLIALVRRPLAGYALIFILDRLCVLVDRVPCC
jgi:hypothetical protein